MTAKNIKKGGKRYAKNRQYAALAIVALIVVIHTATTTTATTTTTTLPEYHQVMAMEWFLAFWTFWMNLLPTPLSYLPLIIFVMLVGFMSLYKSRNIAVPVILLLLFLTSAGAQVVAAFGLVGLIIMGVVVLALVVAYMKIFY